jgi:nucleoid DNA-binding protein
MVPTTSPFSSLAETGDDFQLWMAVAQAIPARRAAVGGDALTQLQRQTWAVWAASGAIGNGGFWDRKPSELDEWAVAYEAIGIADAAASIRAAPALMHRVRAGDPTAAAELKVVEKAFYAANKQTRQVIAALIRQNPQEAFADLHGGDLGARLTPREVIARLAERTGLSEEQVKGLLEAQAELAFQHVSDGFPFPGLGVLEVNHHPERTMVMRFGPKKGEEVHMPPKTVAKFRLTAEAMEMILRSRDSGSSPPDALHQEAPDERS